VSNDGRAVAWRLPDGNGFTLTAEILDFLKNWLIKHIMGVDRRYVTCFVENGVR
jgi:hemerythrin